MKVLLGVVAIVAIVLLLARSMMTSPPAVHANLDEVRMRSMIETLFHRGYDGGLLFLEVRGTDQFLQLRKEIRADGNVVLRCDFPLVPWSKPFYAEVKRYLDSAAVSYRDIPGGGDVPMQGSPERALIISLGADLVVAESFVDHVFRNVFRVDPARQVVGTFENVSPRDTRIGFDP